MSHQEIDRRILLFCDDWQIVAMVVEQVARGHSVRAEANDEIIVVRIRGLIRDGKLDCRGTSSRWSHSEIRTTVSAPHGEETR